MAHEKKADLDLYLSPRDELSSKIQEESLDKLENTLSAETKTGPDDDDQELLLSNCDSKDKGLISQG